MRELVARHEAEIADLEARLTVAEAAAGAADGPCGGTPRLILLHPDEARRLAPDPVEPAGNTASRPRTTVVRRNAASVGRATPAAVVTAPGDHPAGGPGSEPGGLGSRIVRSHWWWRVGIALVVVALLLLKLG